MKKAVVFGAGNIGRGFLGEIFSESGYETVFLDVVPEVLDELNDSDSYQIEITGEAEPRFVTVTNYRAVNSGSEQAVQELADADIAATCVGARVLGFIAPAIAKGVQLRMEQGGEPLDFILAENQAEVDKLVRDAVYEDLTEEQRRWADKNIGFVSASIGRMVPRVPEEKRRENPLAIVTEAYASLPVDKEAFRGEIPDLKGLVPYAPFSYYIKRKLYMHNMAHALSAYLGAEKGYEYIWQAVGDDSIRDKAAKALKAAGQALAAEYGIPESDLEEHAEDLLNRFANKALGDTTARVGADPVRKLRASDRLVGAASYITEAGLDASPVIEGIVSALQFESPDDPSASQLQQALKDKGIEGVIREFMELDPQTGLGREIASVWRAREGSY